MKFEPFLCMKKKYLNVSRLNILEKNIYVISQISTHDILPW